jgi:hypothetical protein
MLLLLALAGLATASSPDDGDEIVYTTTVPSTEMLTLPPPTEHSW